MIEFYGPLSWKRVKLLQNICENNSGFVCVLSFNLCLDNFSSLKKILSTKLPWKSRSWWKKKTNGEVARLKRFYQKTNESVEAFFMLQLEAFELLDLFFTLNKYFRSAWRDNVNGVANNSKLFRINFKTWTNLSNDRIPLESIDLKF